MVVVSSDCGWDLMWDCHGKGSEAIKLGPCTFGCCGKTGYNSICCNDSECIGCDESYTLKIPAALAILPSQLDIRPNYSGNYIFRNSIPNNSRDFTAKR
ncbi:9580_t:CDS:2 [Funneliformis caledonium]|uniref:9580_t:CDS:1 n=1 Tax=Funneliformis caledonium TaxID=1117310 RepID=A0A9N8WCV7_9GLOM|nr:9580_t:CDS:2 [Funneliformis caledonium]